MSGKHQLNVEIYERLFLEHPQNCAVVHIPESSQGLHNGHIVEVNHAFKKTFKLCVQEQQWTMNAFMSTFFEKETLKKFSKQTVFSKLDPTQEEIRLFSEPLNRYFIVKSYHLDPQHVVAYFKDISEEQMKHSDMFEKTNVLSNLVKELDHKNIELESLNQKLFMDSITDSLTKIYNRQFLIYSLETNSQHYRQRKVPFSIAMFDIDFFKQVNDNFGHLTGDRLLVDLCLSVKACIRDNDIFGRYGGDEFILILPNTSYELAFSIADRVRTSIEANARFSAMGVTISGGVFEYKGEDISQTIESVDKKLYNAKNSGKNRVIG